jgi:hypothetical protein
MLPVPPRNEVAFEPGVFLLSYPFHPATLAVFQRLLRGERNPLRQHRQRAARLLILRQRLPFAGSSTQTAP